MEEVALLEVKGLIVIVAEMAEGIRKRKVQPAILTLGNEENLLLKIRPLVILEVCLN
jgi:hypothetical protein